MKLLRALKGAFVCEYAGEVIGASEAEARWAAASSYKNYILHLNESYSSGVRQIIIDPVRISVLMLFILQLI